MRRRLVPVAAAATLVLAGLTGCAASGDAAAGCTNPLQPGPLSNSVSVDGGSVKVTGPTDVLNAQRSVLHAGSDAGTAAQPGDVVFADVEIVDAASGKSLAKASNSPNLALPKNVLGELEKALKSEQSDSLTDQHLIATALLCAVPGDTIAVGMTAGQSMASQLGSSASVAVLTIRSVAPPRAEGRVQGLPNGFPAVTTDDTGRPGVVLPPQAAPGKIQVAVRVLGSGGKVTAEDVVIGQSLTVSWTGSVVSNAWESGITSFGTVEQPNTEFSFRKLLDGYPAGSQLVILDPADKNPVVHVVDIVAAG